MKINNKKTKNFFKRDKSSIFLIIFVLLFAGVLSRTFLAPKDGATKKYIPGQGFVEQAVPRQMTFSDIINEQAQIKTMNIRGDIASGAMKDGSEYKATITYNPDMLSKISASGASISIDNSKSWTDYLFNWLPILVGLMFVIWIFRGLKSGAGGGIRSLMGQSPTKITIGKGKTTFKDVAGIDSEKRELMEVVEFLKNSTKFKAVGARVPRGILLSGEPGTGKTLLARAIAGEANVPFFAASGSDFSGIIVGLGVAKIKEIFEMAKKTAPCILFIDEIDAIGQKRSQFSQNDHDRDQTLNQLLIEMDGFSNNTGVIVIAATNRPDMLDAALLRPGRFDRQIHIDLPDLSGRRDILNLYIKKIKVSKKVDLQDAARGTTGFSGADLENLLNEAALHAVRNNRKEVTAQDIDEARDKILMGPKKIRKMRQEDIKLTAYHEAGHAFLSIHYRDITDPIHKATIIPRGRALGMVQHLPIDDKVSLTLEELRANLSVFMAGRAAEEIFFGKNKITTGAQSDIAVATKWSRYAITAAGLSDKVGLMAINQAPNFSSTTKSLESASEKTAELVDSEVKAWIEIAYKDAHNILSKNKLKVQELADELLKKETLTGEEIQKIVLGRIEKRKESIMKTPGEKTEKLPVAKVTKAAKAKTTKVTKTKSTKVVKVAKAKK